MASANDGVSLSVLAEFLGAPKQEWIDTFGEPDDEFGPYTVYEGLFDLYIDAF